MSKTSQVLQGCPLKCGVSKGTIMVFIPDFTRRHGSEEKAMRTEAMVAGQTYHLSKILCYMTLATRLQDVDHSEREGVL